MYHLGIALDLLVKGETPTPAVAAVEGASIDRYGKYVTLHMTAGENCFGSVGFM